MTSAVGKTIAVFGGNGFLGRKICEVAVGRGYNVVSVSGSGRKPEHNNLLLDSVEWTKGDIFSPHTYTQQLQRCDAVVDTIGILLEASKYKKVVNNEMSVCDAVSTGSSTGGSTSNPLMKGPAATQSKPMLTYSNYNTQSALILANALVEIKGKDSGTPFVYASADKGFVGIPKGYINSKRLAELELLKLKPAIRPILLRPGFMYNKELENDSFRLFLKNVLQFNQSCGILSRYVRPPIDVSVVAQACIDRIEDESFNGPVLLDDMLKQK